DLLFHNTFQLHLNNLYIYYVAILIYKYFNYKAILPSQIGNLFTPTSQIHNHSTRTNSPLDLFPYHWNCNARLQTIHIQAPAIWNKLPISIRSSHSISIFKSSLKKYLLSNSTTTDTFV